MTDPRFPIPPGPPFSVDVVADVHAGVYPDAVTAVLRQRIATDPEAAALLAALDATVADLASWHEPAPVPMPASYAARLDAVIAGEAAARSGRVVALPPASPASGSSTASPSTAGTPTAGPATAGTPTAGSSAAGSSTAPAGRGSGTTGPGRVSSLDEARGRRTRRWATGLGVAAAIAAVVTIGAIVLRPSSTGGDGLAGGENTSTGASATVGTTGTTPMPSATVTSQPDASQPDASQPAGPGASGPSGPSAGAIVVDPNHLEKLLAQITGTATAGPYADPDRLSACLAANGIKGTNVLGVAAVTYQGSPAYAISLGLDEATAKILIVGNSCGAPGPDLMTSQTTGR